jgi:hypothetical protein
MTSPEPTLEPAPPVLTAKQVPWHRKARAVLLKASEIPWRRAQSVVAPPASEQPPHRARPPLTARQVPWGGASKKAATTAPTPPTPAELSTWALPKSDSSAPREVHHPSSPDDEPTAEQLVAQLTKSSAPFREPKPLAPPGPYKAQPILFAPTRWDLLLQRARAHWVRVGLGGALLVAVLIAAWVLRVLALDAAVAREWHGLEPLLRERCALVPAYVECIESFSRDERYTFAVTTRAQADWRAARTAAEIAAAAARMERVLGLLAKVTNRYAFDGVAKDPVQLERCRQFTQLEHRREQLRTQLRGKIRAYNLAITALNARIDRAPGAWIARLAGVTARAPLYATP